MVISWRSTAAAPFIPPPAVRIARAAARMSSATEKVVACRSPAGPARSMSSAYTVEVHDPSARPCSDHHSARPLPESGSVRSSTCTRAIRPDRQQVASTRPQPVTRRSCSLGSSSTNAGCVTVSTAVRVWACGSWIIAASVAGSRYSRSAAASPGRASVPAGRGLTIRARNSSCPPVMRQTQRSAIGTHSMSFRPPAGTQANTAQSRQIGAA